MTAVFLAKYAKIPGTMTLANITLCFGRNDKNKEGLSYLKMIFMIGK